MKLLDKLIQKRDHHLALAGKFAELIAVLQDDDDVQKMVAQGKLSIANSARRMFSHENGASNGATEPEKRKTKSWSPAVRKAQGLRMKKLWKTRRAFMLKATRKGQKKAVAITRAKRAAAASAETTT
jgi:hypothetical protein